jgi:zinc and cadmium transporter
MVLLYIVAAVAVITAIPLVNLLLIPGRTIQRTLNGLIALAAGFLLGNSFFHLLPEALESAAPLEVLQLVAVGFLFTFGVELIMRWRVHLHPSGSQKKPVGYLVLFDDIAHNIIDAAAIAVTFLISVPLGIATTIAVAMHEIPHEIGDFGTLVYAGFSRGKALLYNFYSELAAFAGVSLVVFGNLDIQILESFSAFTVGVFIYIASVDLIPELHSNPKGATSLWHFLIIAAGFLAMLGITILLPEPN